MEPASGIQPDLASRIRNSSSSASFRPQAPKIQPGKVGSLRFDELHAGQLFLQNSDVIQIFQQIGLALGQPFLSALIGRLASNGPSRLTPL